MKKPDKENRKRTPIIDGDARPDINIDGDEKNQPKDHPIETPEDKRKAATTSNRKDSNSLEDFRDAIQE